MKTFDVSTIEGLKRAEAYQQKLYRKFRSVVVLPAGFNHISILGRRPI